MKKICGMDIYPKLSFRKVFPLAGGDMIGYSFTESSSEKPVDIVLDPEK